MANTGSASLDVPATEGLVSEIDGRERWGILGIRNASGMTLKDNYVGKNARLTVPAYNLMFSLKESDIYHSAEIGVDAEVAFDPERSNGERNRGLVKESDSVSFPFTITDS
jgi:hypothetical protein